MGISQNKTDADQEFQFSCFYLDETLCGFEIELIQEINDDLNITKVPLSPDYIVGIMNLRGQIITVINQSQKIGLRPSKLTKSSRVIVVKSQNEFIGLLVDKVADVIKTTKKHISSPPSNINGVQGRFFKGIVQKKGSDLIALLNIDSILEEENQSLEMSR